MKRIVLWTESSRNDFLEIVRYISEHDPNAAERVSRRITDTVASLASFATGRTGRVEGTFEKVLPGLPYIIAYEKHPQMNGDEMIVILHIIHGARDWPRERWPET